MATIGELMIRAGIDIADVVTGAAAIGKEMDGIASQAEKAFSGLDKMGTRLTDWGAGITAAITLPLAGIGAAAIKAAVDFDEASDRIRAKTGATGEALDGLNAVFKNVFSSIPTSAHDASDAIAALSSRLGLTGQPLQDLAIQELNLARITEESVNPLIATTTRLFGDWSIATEKQAGSLDFLLRVSQGTGVSVTKLSELMVQFGAPMRALGFDLETAATMLGRFEKEGVNIGTIMPGLRMAIKQFAGAGLEGAAAFQSFVDVVKKSDDAQATMIAKTVSGGRAFVDMFRAIKEGRFDLDEMTKKFRESGDTINKAAADTLSFTDKLVLFKNKLETALEPIGTKLTGIFEKWLDNSQPFIKSLNDIADAFANLNPSTQGWILGIAAAAAAIGPLLIAIGGMASGFAALAPVAALAITGLVNFAGAASNVASAVAGNMTGALTAGETALLRMGQAGLLAAAAFAGWELGSWAYKNIAWIKAVGDAISDFILKIPLLGTVAKYVSGITGGEAAMAEAAGSTAFANQKLEDSLKRVGITVDKTGLSAEQYGAKMREAAEGIGTHGAAIDKAKPKVTGAGIDLSVLGKQAKDTGVSIDGIATAFGNLGKGEEETTKEAKRIDSLNNSLNYLFKAYQQGKITFEDYSTAVKDVNERLGELDKAQGDAAGIIATKLQESYGKSLDYLHSINGAEEEITNSIFSQMQKGTVGVVDGVGNMAQMVAAKIKNAFINIKDIGNIFKNIGGTEADANASIAQIEANLNRVRELYYGLAKDLKGNLLVSQADMERLEIDAGEKRIAIARKVGKDVTDAQIASLQGIKTAFTVAHMDIEQAWKTLGVTTTQQYDDQVRVATAAYEKIKNSALSSHQDILKGEAALYADQLSAQEAHGDRVNETQKRQLAKLIDESQHGVDTLAKHWDSLANHIGDAVGKGLDDLATDLLTGKKVGNIKDIFSKIWKDIAASFVKDMIHPLTAAIGTFLSGTLKSLIGGEGFGGVKKAAEEAADSIKKAYGIGGEAVKSSGVPAIPGGTKMDGVTTGGSAGSGSFTSPASLIGIAGVAVNAAAGIVAGVQAAHMNSLLDKIEKSTREISVVTWQTGGESVQGLLKDIRNISLQMRDRLIDLRDAIFAPLALTMEAIDNTLKTLILPALHGVSTGIQDSSETAVYQGDENTQSLQQQIQAGIDANVAQGRDALAVANGIAGAANLTAEEVAGLQKLTADAGNQTASAIVDTSNNLAGTITQSGGEVINALGQTGSAVVQNAANNTQAILDQLAAIGDVTSNAYTDIKTGLIGVAQSVDKAMLPMTETSKMLNDAIFGVQKSTAETVAQMMGLEGVNDWIPRSGGDNTNLFSGPAGYSVNAPLAGINVPVSNPLVSPGFSMQNNYGYVPADPRNSNPNIGPGAGYSRTTTAPISYAPQGNALTINMSGPITNYEYANQLGRNLAEQVVIATR